MKMEQLTYAVWCWDMKTKDGVSGALRDVKQAGFNRWEATVNTVNMFADDVKGLMDICDAEGVAPVSFYLSQKGDRDYDLDVVRRGLDFFAAVGVDVYVVQAPRKEGGGATEKELADCLSTMEAVGDMSKKYGITPCLHPHANTLVMFESDIDFILTNTDPACIGFCPDTAHLMVGNCDPLEICTRYVDRIKSMHLKDVKKNHKVTVDTEATDPYEVFTDFLELGSGDVDLVNIMRLMESVEYKGNLTVELDRAPVSNRDSAFNNMAYIKKVMANL